MRFLNLFLIPLLFFASSCEEKTNTVKIGFIGPLTGGLSANGLGGRNSAQLAIDQFNSSNSSKYTYELVPLDDECKPNIGIQVATKIATNKNIIGAVTHYCSSVAMGTVDIYHKFQLPIIIWGAVLPEITYGNGYKEIHRVNGTMINQNEVAAEFMTDLGYKTWVIIHDTTDYGKGHDKYFTKFIEENGGKILARFGVTADQQDMTAELTKTKALNPDVIYFGGLSPVGVRIKNQMQRLGIDSVLQGTSGIVSDSYIKGLGALANGTYAFQEGAPINKLSGGKQFQESYDKANFAEPPEAYGAFSYAATKLLIETIERVGPDRLLVTQQLNTVQDYESIIGKISFDSNGQNTVPLITKYVVKDEKWTIWEDIEK